LVRSVDEDKSPFSIMEKRDEAQILAEIRGEVIEEYFYKVKDKTAISWIGVKELARQYGRLDTELIEMRETEDSWIVVIKAKDIEKGSGMLGTSVQSKIDQYNGEPDEFCLQKAFSKAQRNALKSLLPESLFAAALDEWQSEKGKGKKIFKKTEKKSAKKKGKPVKVQDFAKPIELQLPEWGLPDELNRADDSWSQAKKITETWMKEAGFNMADYEIAVDGVKIKVTPLKAIPMAAQPDVNGVMLAAGFSKSKGIWRLNKSEVVD